MFSDQGNQSSGFKMARCDIHTVNSVIAAKMAAILQQWHGTIAI